MKPNNKHTLIAEILGRMYVKSSRNRKPSSVAARPFIIHDYTKPSPVWGVSYISMVSNNSADKSRFKPVVQRRNESVEQRDV